MSHNFFLVNDLWAQENANEIRGSAILPDPPTNVTIHAEVLSQNLSELNSDESSLTYSKKILQCAFISHIILIAGGIAAEKDRSNMLNWIEIFFRTAF